MDICVYAGLRWFEALGVASFLSRAWVGTVASLSATTQQICAHLWPGIAQTLEASHQVVGFDVAWEISPEGGMGPVQLVTRDLSDGLQVGSAACVLLARTTTKDESWLGGGPVHTSLEPRVTHRALDVRVTSERVASLIQWWVRFSDGFWRGDLPEGPPRARKAGDPGWTAPEAEVIGAWWWHSQLVVGMLRELVFNGWGQTDVIRSLYRARASARTRCQTPAIQRRDRFLGWVMHIVSCDWNTLLRTSPDSRPGARGVQVVL